MIRNLTRCIRENKWAAILSPLCMVGEVYMEVHIPQIIARLVDMGITPGNMNVVWQQGLMLVLTIARQEGVEFAGRILER